MIEQTIPLRQMTSGMAACVREWLLPHLSDAMARIQAEQLILLLEELPCALEPAARERIRADTEEGRALLRQMGEAVDQTVDCCDVDELMGDNAAVKIRLELLAARFRARSQTDAVARDGLLELQRYFVRSAQREWTGSKVQIFEEMTTRDRKAKDHLRQDE